MQLWVHSLLSGATLGLVASVAPGANNALCVALARSGTSKALPVILGAALTDCAYSMLCSLGALQAIHLQGWILAWFSVGSLLAAAILIWPTHKPAFGARSAGCVAALNPATAALWMGMSSTLVASENAGSIAPVALALGTLIATGGWFSTLGYVSHRLEHYPIGSDRLGRIFSLALVMLAFARACLQLHA
ncbi:MAG TPA: hypothetical protein VID48_15755 [Solirubrobacteraceae bacterium]